MAKPKPEFIFAAFCYVAGNARAYSDADWRKLNGVSDLRGRIVTRLCLVAWAVLSPLWWYEWE